MKSLRNLFLYLIVALYFIPTAHAEEAVDAPSEKPTTELKNDGEIIILEGTTVEVKTPNAANSAKRPEIQVEKPQEVKNEKEESNKTETRINESKEETSSEKQKDNKLDVTYDQKTAEINKKANEEIRQREKERQAEKNQPPAETKPSETTVPNPKIEKELSPDVKKLVNEIDKFLKDVPEEKPSTTKSTTYTKSEEAKNVRKAVDMVSEVITSDKISKADSEKIATVTKEIVEEYNKKIEAASSEAQKENLRKEAVEKINQSIKNTSKEAYDIINKESEDLTIDDQKNEPVMVELDVENKEKISPSDDDKDNKTQQKSLSKSSRLNQESTSFKPNVLITFILVSVLVIGILAAIGLAIKQRNNKRK